MEFALEQLGIQRYFDAVTVSDVLGILKPDPGIFEHALRSIDIPAGEAIFVDDVGEPRLAWACGPSSLIDVHIILRRPHRSSTG